ncbi:MAG TPA: aldehyde dehydrogenase family protein, partial [Planctomycetota bacterium]|nr:aldehyde dehydrogenase family protein [Planctomycetota bacterium]
MAPRTRRKAPRDAAARNGVPRAEAKPRARARRRPPELPFGGVWSYAPAPEASDHFTIPARADLFVGGRFVPARDGRTYTTIDPAREEPLAEVAFAGADDVDRAVAAARAALPAWRALPGADRARYLFRIARLIQERARELAC